MNSKRIIIYLILVASLLTVLIVTGINYTYAQGDDVVVIVHKTRAGLSKIQIKRIFTGDVDRWPDGSKVKIFNNSDKSIVKEFCKKYLNLKPNFLDRLWLKREIRDGVPSPRKLPSNVIVTMVVNSSVFISYVRRSEVKSDVNILE